MKIPKIYHHFWAQGDLPKEFQLYRESWKKYHPDWEFKMWTKKNLFPLINEECLSLCNNYSEMSDLVRYELLYKYGGIYLDTDFECYKNIEPLIENLEIFASTENDKHICGGFIGSVPKHKIIRQVIKKIPRKLVKTKGKRSDLRIGPTFLTRAIKPYKIDILPRVYFYPYLPGQEFLLETIKKEGFAYAAHRWSASWLKK